MKGVFYCSNLINLKEKLKEDGHYNKETGLYTVIKSITPIIHKGNTSLGYVENFPLDLEVYTMLEYLGDYEELFLNEDSLNKYKSVNNYEEPIEFYDKNKKKYIYYRPKRIGEFA